MRKLLLHDWLTAGTFIVGYANQFRFFMPWLIPCIHFFLVSTLKLFLDFPNKNLFLVNQVNRLS